jgi:hypothetical protein
VPNSANSSIRFIFRGCFLAFALAMMGVLMRDKKEETEQEKHPIDMTSDELLDYSLAPEIAEKLRKIARSDKPEKNESEDGNG